MKVLIAEDNPLERLLLRSGLEKLGHECCAAADGGEAWALYQNDGADVVISDWLMPGLDGPELCRRIRAEGRMPYTYFLFLTALGAKRNVLEGLQAGADDYLLKPLDIDDLEARLLVALRVKRLEEERAELVAKERAERLQAQQALRMRDQVLAAVSHDLRTPLTVIKGTVDVLQHGLTTETAPDRDGLLHGLGRIAAGVTRMNRWIEDILDATRLQMGEPLSLARQLTDLVGLAEQAAADQQQTTQYHRIRVQSAQPAIFGLYDAARLRRVLDNLLSNAVKYSPAGGEVTVKLGTEAGSAGTGTRWAVLQVLDQGVGIPTADQAHIFERYRRGANVGDIGGAGLGLAGARDIVLQHGGSLELESQAGAGSVFTVRIPLQPPVPP
jgi:signal transduction histidine kinase